MAFCEETGEGCPPVSSMTRGERTKTLCHHVRTGDFEGVRKLLLTGEFQGALLFPDNHEGVLHVAAVYGHTDIVKLLLSHNTNVNATNGYGQIPLHLACRRGHVDIVKLLLDAASVIDYKDCGECTPLFHAVGSNQTAVVKLLIEAGCDLDTLNEELITPLDQAIICNQPEMVSLLIKGGCQWEKMIGVVYPDHFTSSIVYSLWQNQDFDNISLLLECGFRLKHSMPPILETLLQITIPSAVPKFHNICLALKNPASLKSLCRITIRSRMIAKRQVLERSLKDMTSELPLPGVLKLYLNFENHSLPFK